MYASFVVLPQEYWYLLLKKTQQGIHTLKLDLRSCRYGSLNDEAHRGHLLATFGLGVCGLYKVENSPWIQEMIANNRVHLSHQDSLFGDLSHEVLCFKDVKLECVCSSMNEVVMSEGTFAEIIQEQTGNLLALRQHVRAANPHQNHSS